MKFTHFLVTFSLITIASVAVAQDSPVVEVFRSAHCGCCGQWVEHMRQAGFQVNVHDVADVPAARRKLGMPERFGSCHTANVGGYAIEGHVPAEDVKRLLAEKPKAVGLAVPSMPPGSPGMENGLTIPYETLLVQSDSTFKVYARH